MRLIKQKDESGCGIAAVAMLAGVSYEVAKDLIFPDRTTRKRSFVTDTGVLRDALRGLGVPVADGCIRVKDKAQLKQDALLKVNRQKSGGFHWCVWDSKRRRILDPGVPPIERLEVFAALFIGTPGQEEYEE